MAETTINRSVVLERQFSDTTAQLTSAGLYLTDGGSDKSKKFIRISEIFACEIARKQQSCRTGTVTELVIHAFVLKVKRSLCREKVQISLKFDNMTEAQEWERSIVRLSRHTTAQKFLVFINPNSGAGKAKAIFHETVEPMFRLTGVEYDVKVTERPQHAHDYVRDDVTLSTYTGIIVCGGDGLMYEVMNGLAARKDWHDIMEALTFGVIPCGSGNGLVASMNGTLDGDPLVRASLAIVRNNTSKMDLVRVDTPDRTYHSFLSITWGYMAVVDIRSEAIKALVGNARFTIWALKDVVFMKKYKATVSYLPLDSEDTMPDLTAALSSNWITVEDEFIAITAAFQTHLSPDLHFAPDARLNDGKIWLCLVRSTISRYKFLFDFLLKLEHGTHIPTNPKDPDVQMIQCKAMRIVPKCTDGCIAVDGEEITFGPIQAQIIPSIANVFVPGSDDVIASTMADKA